MTPAGVTLVCRRAALRSCVSFARLAAPASVIPSAREIEIGQGLPGLGQQRQVMLGDAIPGMGRVDVQSAAGQGRGQDLLGIQFLDQAGGYDGCDRCHRG